MGRKSKSKHGSSQETEFDNPLTPAAKDAAVERGGAIFESTSTDNATGTATFDKEEQALGGEEVSGAEWGTLKIGQAMAKGDVDVVILNWCRNACASIWLDSVVLAAIILNTILLAIESPANTLSEETLDMIVIIDMVLTIGFTVEMFIRIIAMGFWDRKGEGTAPNTVYRPCYLNDDWNKLDFFVVISSWVNVVVEYVGTINVDLSTLRALRILRVLKAFKKIEGIRQILATIAQAIPYSINVIAFLAFLFVICGIIGVQMFRGAGKKRCVYGGFDLTAHLDPDKFPLVTLNSGNVSTVLGNSHPWPQPPPVLEPTYEYPIGIGVWISYCDVDSDCPLFDVPDQWNRTQTCQPSLNPGKGYQHFDTIIDAWIALFINMANLYWWETAHRISDANVGMGSVIAWGFGAFNVFFLSYVTVNMFVAVITTVFMDVRSEGNAEGGFGAGTDETFEEKFKRQARELQEASDRWKKPPYFVPLFGGEGPFIESAKEDPAERKGLIWALWFDRGILGFIFINTFALAAEHHDRSSCDDPTTLEIEMQSNELCMDQDFVEANMYANYVFNFVFTVECIMKVGGMGFVEYIKPAFNKLDFFIVVTSGLDMIGEAMATDDEGSGVGIFKLFRVFRLFRVLRVARILYKNKNLKRVLTTVFGSGDAIANLVLFIFFAVLLFAIMGMHLTGGRYHPEHKPEMGYGDNSGTLWGRLIGSGQYDVRFLGNETRHGYNVQDFIRKGLIPRRNFEDFPRAFLLAFQVMTGDDWVNQMHDVMEVKGGIVPPLLFFANFSFCNFILLNLFIAVILENFEIAEAEKAALQKMKYEQDKVAEVEAARKPKIKFVHRLVWLVGGEGKKSGSLCGMSEDVGLDTEGAYSELDADGDPVEFGMIMPGSKWYNDDKALFFMDRDHSARKVTKALAENQIFDFVVLCAILLGTLLLALEGPPGSIDEDTQFIFDRINDLLFGIFIVEFVAKVCAYGFMFTPQSYLMNAWNKLDFIVILGSVANYMGGNVGFIRLLRCLRPLRIINRNEGMRVIISAVVNSLAVNLGVLALSGLGLLIFAILGVSLFAGQFWSCNCSFTYPLGVTPTAAVFHYNGGWTMHSANISHPGPPQEVLTEQHCVGVNGTGGLFGVDGAFPDSVVQCYWDNRPYNFDTTPNAMMALFTASTLAGWTDIMEVGLDGTGIGMQPVPFSGVWGAKVVYFLVYVMVMSFFVTNLFVGVLIDFIGSSDGTALLTVKQQEAKDLSKFQKLHRPTLRDSAPDNCFRSWFWHLVESRFWDQLSNGFIIFNVIVMMCEYEPELGEEDAWQRWMNALELLNMVCLWFFTIEMVFKLIAYFPIKYWADPWSKFDATVITLSWAAIIFDLGSVQAIRAMRALRIVLVLKNAKGIRSLFQTLIMSIAPATNITVLLLLLYAIYAIAGMMLFGTMPVQDVECTSRPTPLQPDYCSPQYGIAEEDIASWFSGIAKGKAGQYLMGANRQYTHHSSFRNFGSAMTLLFQCAAGQDWKFVMYAIGGEPGRDADSGLTFIFFSSFLFFSNYILLNLFVATILDSFAASMREQEMSISEEDFKLFKYTFRDFTSRSAPELLPYRSLWPLLRTIGYTIGHDDDGNEIESVLAPPPYVTWTGEEQICWKLCRTDADAPEDVRDFLKSFYEHEFSPLTKPAERKIALHFDAWYEHLMSTAGVFECADVISGQGEDAPVDEHSVAWELWRIGGAVGGPPSYDIIQWAVRTLRFRLRFQNVLAELKFHGHLYINETSTVNYNDLLQAQVSLQLGKEGRSLEEQLAREAAAEAERQAGDSRFRAANWAKILHDRRATLVMHLEGARINGNTAPKTLAKLEKDLASIELAIAESDRASSVESLHENVRQLEKTGPLSEQGSAHSSSDSDSGEGEGS